MKRREFVKQALSGAATGAAALGAAAAGSGILSCTRHQSAPAAHTRPSLRWRLASSFPRGLDTIFGSAEVLAERVAALSEDRFQIRPYPAGELVPGLQVMAAVQQGTVQTGPTARDSFPGKNPPLAFQTCGPSGPPARQPSAWLY